MSIQITKLRKKIYQNRDSLVAFDLKKKGYTTNQVVSIVALTSALWFTLMVFLK